jgi:hypothetical protein
VFNFSANHLSLLTRIECRKCVVFVMRHHSANPAYRLYDFAKSPSITAGQYYCVSEKINSADKLYLVIETVETDSKLG